MSSASTLIGCGMRNITSCLFSRCLRFEEKKSNCISPENSSGSIVFDFTGRRPAKISPENMVLDEEDYLVFLFREDGAIDLVNSGDCDEDENLTYAHIVTGEEKESKDELENCDSNISDTSSESFSFPILKIEEWMGSPVYMPKQEKQGVRLHCCRF
ncbi:hypothetical protein SASPL_154206 [Salvia splendens]|uniref:Uncharacterized protein n=1 Tax=Salvia splendens TaxID=180675 RepID=A0A8X8VZP7_SALSN|nr:uncharacterized protein LOC121786671 [Salvia splendens]KAG6385371.1 hypothetical protein SASPL_154206 [Salvia splendens]